MNKNNREVKVRYAAKLTRCEPQRSAFTPRLGSRWWVAAVLFHLTLKEMTFPPIFRLPTLADPSLASSATTVF